METTTKRCSNCTLNKSISDFVNENKTCTKCREKSKRYKQSEKGKAKIKQTKKIYIKTSVKNKLYEYVKGADDRHLCFYLDEEYAEQLFKENCHYCGYGSPENLNGIDRMDNTRGYTPYNCVSCCKRCNFAKGTLGYCEFIELCTLISKRFNGKGTL